MRVDSLALEAEDLQHLTIALVNFLNAKQQLLKDETLARSCPQRIEGSHIIVDGQIT